MFQLKPFDDPTLVKNSKESVDISAHQIFHCVRSVVPLWGAELVATLHDHPQHQHLLAMPERR